MDRRLVSTSSSHARRSGGTSGATAAVRPGAGAEVPFCEKVVSGAKNNISRGASRAPRMTRRVVTILLSTHTIPNDSRLPQGHPTRPRNHPGTRNCAGMFFGGLEFYFLWNVNSQLKTPDEICDPDHVFVRVFARCVCIDAFMFCMMPQ